MNDAHTLRFPNGVTLSLAMDGERFLGIGEVACGGMPLRSGVLPWTLYTESDQGMRFADSTLARIEREGDTCTLVLLATGSWLPRLQAADAMGDARIATRRARPPQAELRWTFRPLAERIAEHDCVGLAMQVSFSCPGHPVHWLIEDATWELGGSAACATLIQQDVSTIGLEQTVAPGAAFSTIEKFFTDGWGGAYPMDMLPRAAGASILDFQVKDSHVLMLFAERPGLTRARLEKFADEDLIHYTDRPFVALAERAVFPERKLLVHRRAQPFKRHEWRNLWLDAFCEVRARIHAAYGFRAEEPLPTVWSHLWDAELAKLGAAWHQPLIEALPRYRDLGFRQVFTHGVWESVTSDPARSPGDGNICAPYDYRFAEAYGGAAGMKALTGAARAAGLQVMQWFSFHFSKFSPLWKQHPDWVLREANGDPWDGNYHILWSGRMRSGYGEHFRESIARLHEEAGLDAIFWDSFQNLGVTCIDWQAPDKAPQAEEIWRMQAELQRRGFTSQRPEITTIFGVGTVAMFGFADDKFRRRLWNDTVRNDDAFALLDCAPAFFGDHDPFTADRLDPERYFWLLAHRCVPAMPARPWTAALGAGVAPELPGGELAERYGRANRLYGAALPRMRRLRLVEGGGHVLWLDAAGQPAVIWAFRAGQAYFSGPVREADGDRRYQATGVLELAAGQVYLLGAAAGGEQPARADQAR
jgi:hypothetical protein